MVDAVEPVEGPNRKKKTTHPMWAVPFQLPPQQIQWSGDVTPEHYIQLAGDAGRRVIQATLDNHASNQRERREWIRQDLQNARIRSAQPPRVPEKSWHWPVVKIQGA